jgi:hypothetical protein
MRAAVRVLVVVAAVALLWVLSQGLGFREDTTENGPVTAQGPAGTERAAPGGGGGGPPRHAPAPESGEAPGPTLQPAPAPVEQAAPAPEPVAAPEQQAPAPVEPQPTPAPPQEKP